MHPKILKRNLLSSVERVIEEMQRPIVNHINRIKELNTSQDPKDIGLYILNEMSPQEQKLFLDISTFRSIARDMVAELIATTIPYEKQSKIFGQDLRKNKQKETRVVLSGKKTEQLSYPVVMSIQDTYKEIYDSKLGIDIGRFEEGLKKIFKSFSEPDLGVQEKSDRLLINYATNIYNLTPKIKERYPNSTLKISTWKSGDRDGKVAPIQETIRVHEMLSAEVRKLHIKELDKLENLSESAEAKKSEVIKLIKNDDGIGFKVGDKDVLQSYISELIGLIDEEDISNRKILEELKERVSSTGLYFAEIDYRDNPQNVTNAIAEIIPESHIREKFYLEEDESASYHDLKTNQKLYLLSTLTDDLLKSWFEEFSGNSEFESSEMRLFSERIDLTGSIPEVFNVNAISELEGKHNALELLALYRAKGLSNKVDIALQPESPKTFEDMPEILRSVLNSVEYQSYILDRAREKGGIFEQIIIFGHSDSTKRWGLSSHYMMGVANDAMQSSLKSNPIFAGNGKIQVSLVTHTIAGSMRARGNTSLEELFTRFSSTEGIKHSFAGQRSQRDFLLNPLTAEKALSELTHANLMKPKGREDLAISYAKKSAGVLNAILTSAAERYMRQYYDHGEQIKEFLLNALPYNFMKAAISDDRPITRKSESEMGIDDVRAMTFGYAHVLAGIAPMYIGFGDGELRNIGPKQMNAEFRSEGNGLAFQSLIKNLSYSLMLSDLEHGRVISGLQEKSVDKEKLIRRFLDDSLKTRGNYAPAVMEFIESRHTSSLEFVSKAIRGRLPEKGKTINPSELISEWPELAEHMEFQKETLKPLKSLLLVVNDKIRGRSDYDSQLVGELYSAIIESSHPVKSLLHPSLDKALHKDIQIS